MKKIYIHLLIISIAFLAACTTQTQTPVNIAGLKLLDVSESDLFFEKDEFVYYAAGSWSGNHKLINVDAKTFKIISEYCKLILDKNSVYQIKWIDDSPVPGGYCGYDPCYHYEAMDLKINIEEISEIDEDKCIIN